MPEWARTYRNFVAAFVVLYERDPYQDTAEATAKQSDHLLTSPVADHIGYRATAVASDHHAARPAFQTVSDSERTERRIGAVCR